MHPTPLGTISPHRSFHARKTAMSKPCSPSGRTECSGGSGRHLDGPETPPLQDCWTEQKFVPETLRFMRLLVLAFVAALSLTTLAAAQPLPNQPNKQTACSWRIFPRRHRSAARLASRNVSMVHMESVYTMRSYIFERRGTEAPRRVGMVTCTRSSQRQFKRAKPAPKPNIIPAD